MSCVYRIYAVKVDRWGSFPLLLPMAVGATIEDWGWAWYFTYLRIIFRAVAYVSPNMHPRRHRRSTLSSSFILFYLLQHPLYKTKDHTAFYFPDRKTICR